MIDDLQFFFPDLDPAEAGNIPLPPKEMRFIEFKVEPIMDNGPARFRVYLETTAFQQRPYMEVTLFDRHGEELTSVSIIEPMQRKNVITMHLRGEQKQGNFCLKARLFYPEPLSVDSDFREINFEI